MRNSVQSYIFSKSLIKEIESVRSPVQSTKPISKYILGGLDRPLSSKPQLE